MNDICVLIPHYNNPRGLSKSIQSINENVDLLIVDDGSKTLFDEDDIKNGFSGQGSFTFIYLDNNAGIEEALNTGLRHIDKVGKYQFVARLDCGDICHQDRFIKQYSFLKKNSEIAMVGTWAKVLDLDDNFLFNVTPPLDHTVLQKKMYFNCMFIHPSVMFRSSIISKIGYYPYDFEAAEDYAFFFNVIKNYKTANIGEYLISYQIDPNSISSVKRKRQVLSRIKVIWRHFYIGYYPIVGLLRNSILLLLPISFINGIKLITNRK